MVGRPIFSSPYCSRGDAEPDHNEARIVEGRHRLALHILEIVQRRQDAEAAEGHVDVEDPAPGCVSGQDAAQQRPDHRPQDRRQGHVGHGRDQLRPREAAQQDQPAHRGHHGAAQPLQHPHRQQHAEAVGHAAQRRAEGEDAERQSEDPARAEPVGEPAADRDEHGQGQDIGGHRQIQPQRRGVQAGRHVRDGGGDDGGVELLHQEGDGDDHRDDHAQPRIPLRHELGLVGDSIRYRHMSGLNPPPAAGTLPSCATGLRPRHAPAAALRPMRSMPPAGPRNAPSGGGWRRWCCASAPPPSPARRRPAPG